ncbi:MAG: hypothetical protein N2560_06455, partial [Ignavibacteria bacterium]|nr:hypothetical protein [Ignavibacteria bacterium]
MSELYKKLLVYADVIEIIEERLERSYLIHIPLELFDKLVAEDKLNDYLLEEIENGKYIDTEIEDIYYSNVIDEIL